MTMDPSELDHHHPRSQIPKDPQESVSVLAAMVSPVATTASGIGKRCTFVSIADIGLKNESVADFKRWFSEVNSKVLSQYKGFLGRVLIESPDGKNHKILFMTEDKESFLAIRSSPQHKELHARALTFMTKPPVVSFYGVAAT